MTICRWTPSGLFFLFAPVVHLRKSRLHLFFFFFLPIFYLFIYFPAILCYAWCFSLPCYPPLLCSACGVFFFRVLPFSFQPHVFPVTHPPFGAKPSLVLTSSGLLRWGAGGHDAASPAQEWGGKSRDMYRRRHIVAAVERSSHMPAGMNMSVCPIFFCVSFEFLNLG